MTRLPFRFFGIAGGLAIGATAFVMACSDRQVPTRPPVDLQEEDAAPLVAVTPLGSPTETDVLAALIDSMAMEVPEGQRSALRTMLSKGDHVLLEGKTARANDLVKRFNRSINTRDSSRLARKSLAFASANPAGAIIVLVPSLPVGTAVGVRRERAGRNVLSVTAETKPVELALALDVLQSTRRKHGDFLPNNAKFSIKSRSADSERTSPKLETAKLLLDRLRRVAPKTIEGYGRVPSVKVRLGALRP